MTEPTLLQQARHFFDASDALLMRGVPGVEAVALRNAMGRILQHLEQQQAAGLPVASTLQRYTSAAASEPKCKEVCGQSWTAVDHSHPRATHGFEPDIALCDHLAAPPPITDEDAHAVCRDLGIDTTAWAAQVRKRVADALDLDELQRLCDAATPGPWEADGFCVSGDNGEEVGAVLATFTALDGGTANAALAAAARDALPKLIARVRELQGEVQRLNDAFDHNEADEWAEAEHG